MGLTIPKAGVIGGAAMSAPQVDAGHSGEIIAGFGDKMMQIGLRLVADQEQRSLGTARVAAMRGFNDLQTKYQQVGDPDAVDRGYAADSAALRESVVNTVPPGAREQAGAMFDEMAVPHAAQIGRRAISLRQSAEIATIMDAGAEFARTAAVGDPQVVAASAAQIDSQIDGAVSRGVMTPEEAQRIRARFATDSGQARATRMLSDDPGALIGAIDGGEFAHMPADQVQGWRTRGVAKIEAEKAAAAAETKRANGERLTVAAALLKDGIGVYRAGRDFAGSDQVNELLQDPIVAATPEAREYLAAQQLHQAMPAFAALPPAQKREALAQAKSGALSKDYDNKVVTAMEVAIAADEKGYATDPLTRAAEVGLKAAPDLPDPSDASPRDLAVSLKARWQYSQSLQGEGYTTQAKFFTAAERERWKPLVGPDASPEQKSRLAASLAAGLGPDAERAAVEIGADPLFSYVGGGLAHGLSPQLGREIFEGQRVIDGKQVQLPAEAKRNQVFFLNFSSLFSDGTQAGWGDQSAARNQIVAATDALYALRMRGKVIVGSANTATLDPDVYLQAAHEVMGGTGQYDGDNATGGVQNINGHMTLLPPGVSAGNVERNLEVLSSGLGNDVVSQRFWKSISVSGSIPDLGGDQMDARTLRGLMIRPVNNDSYIFLRPRADGRQQIVLGGDGAPFQFRMSSLMLLEEHRGFSQ